MQSLKQLPTFFFIRLFLVFLALFFVMRLAFLWLYPHEFETLTFGETLYAMVKGAWFLDSSITMVFLGIPFLLTYLPLKLFVSNGYLRLISWYAFALLAVFIVIAVGDLLYFGFVHRHTGHELAAAMQTSVKAMVEMLVSAYWHYMLIFVAALLVASRFWKQLMMPPSGITHIKMGWKRAPFFFVMFLIILLTMRGGIDSKPIQVVFAYNEGSMAMGHLTLNGVFATFHSLHASEMRVPSFMPREEAVSIVRDIYQSQHEIYPEPDNYPFMRERSSTQDLKQKLNVVVLLLESWDPDFLDITRELAGKEPYGVTPNYNALAKKGRLYTNFYANGQRSIDGIAALIAGIPRVPGAGGIGEGIEMNDIGWMGDIARKQGYQTSFLSGSYRHSFYMDKISPLAGFDTYYGSEDLTSLHPDAPKSQWGGWDYDLLMAGHELLKESKQPFLSVMFSVSTHTPWALPSDQWKKYPGKNDQEKFLNTIYYTDWVLGEYFKAVEASSYADNTLFFILADHASGNMGHPTMRDQYRIPLLVVGPNVEQGIDETLSSQIDLIPTIIDLAGWQKSRYASLGASIVEDRANRSVIFGRDALTGRIEEGGELVIRSLDRLMYSEGDEARISQAEHRLKAQVQLMLESWQQNQLMKKEHGE